MKLSKPYTLELRSEYVEYQHTITVRPCQIQCIRAKATDESQSFFTLHIYLAGGQKMELVYQTCDDNLEGVATLAQKVEDTWDR